MRINWKVRVKNPYFWFGLIAIILAAVGAKPEMFTNWTILIVQVKNLLSNPFALGCAYQIKVLISFFVICHMVLLIYLLTKQYYL